MKKILLTLLLIALLCVPQALAWPRDTTPPFADLSSCHWIDERGVARSISKSASYQFVSCDAQLNFWGSCYDVFVAGQVVSGLQLGRLEYWDDLDGNLSPDDAGVSWVQIGEVTSDKTDEFLLSWTGTTAGKKYIMRWKVWDNANNSSIDYMYVRINVRPQPPTPI